ncbi:MAG TPA: hypothetical protein PKG48_06025, partial [Bacteroidales bacterium]|nr:hypothetical protein [Bacteroidales bacterium]
HLVQEFFYGKERGNRITRLCLQPGGGAVHILPPRDGGKGPDPGLSYDNGAEFQCRNVSVFPWVSSYRAPKETAGDRRLTPPDRRGTRALQER